MDGTYLSVKGALQEHPVPFEEIEHEPMFTSDQEEQITGLPAERGAKSLLLKVKGKKKEPYTFVLVVIPGNTKANMPNLKGLLNTKSISFASADAVKEILGCELGACHPFGCLHKIRTIVDNSLLRHEKIAINPGLNTKTILIAPKDYLTVANPEVHDNIGLLSQSAQ